MNPRQNADLKNVDSVSSSNPDTAAHILRMRKVTLFEGRMEWRRKFRTPLPMFVLVRNGVLIIRRPGMTRMAYQGDVLLLTPGSFELTAVPMSADGMLRLEYARIPPSVFRKLLSRGSAIEEVALGAARYGEYNGIHICNRMLPQVARALQFPNLTMTPIELVTQMLMVSLCPAVFPFLRSVYFERRWAFLGMMEAHTLRPRPVEFLAARYVTGRAAFFRDCLLYTGHSPAKWFARRQMELADVWIHVGNRPIVEVAARLHCDDVRRFRAAFRKQFHRPPEDPGIDVCRSLSPDDPSFCLRPFWWPAPLPLAGAPAWSTLCPERFVEPNSASESVDAPVGLAEAPIEPANATAESCVELPADAASELPPNAACKEEPPGKSIEERFRTGEMIPITEIIEFPTGLPDLLKAA